MTDQELLTSAKKLQQEAKRVLKSLGVLDILKTISEPEIVGSVKSGLMIHNDIDIHCAMDGVDIEKIAALMPLFAKMPTINKVQFNNYRTLRRDHLKERIRFPHAYYMGLRSVEPSGEWKIDMWFGDRGDLGDFDESQLEALTNEQRVVVLHLKNAMKEGKGYRDGVISTDFYNAVLHHGVRDLSTFKKYLTREK